MWLEVNGQTSRASKIARTVRFEGGRATLVDSGKTTTLSVPRVAFPQPGYSPVAFQEAMLAYWKSKGSPGEVFNPGQPPIHIEARGKDKVTVGGKTSDLNRYSVAGLIWGRETLWTNGAGRLVAEVGCDAEFDHFEAIDEAYTGELGFFVKRAAEDAMGVLVDMSKKLNQKPAALTAIVGGKLVDGLGGPPVENSVVVVRDGRIVASGPASEVKVPAGAQTVDARGKTVLPGLWDMHAHYEQVEWGPIYLATGVTTVRDCGNEFEYIVPVRDAIDHGRGLGPRLLLAGLVDGTSKMSLGTVRVDTPEQVRAAVDRYFKAGFRQMKIYSSVKPEMVKLICEEAHKKGMSVTGHIPQGMNMEDGIQAGMDQVNHFQYVLTQMRAWGNKNPILDPESEQVNRLIALMKAHNTVLDDTMILFYLSLHKVAKPEEIEPGIMKVAPELRGPLLSMIGQGSPVAAQVMDSWLKVLGKLHKSGITLMAGTDQAVPGFSVDGEIELYVKAGFTPMEAIQAATSVPARVMGLEKESGSIGPGKRADILIVDGDPLSNISDIRKVSLVFANGRPFRPAPLWTSVEFAP